MASKTETYKQSMASILSGIDADTQNRAAAIFDGDKQAAFEDATKVAWAGTAIATDDTFEIEWKSLSSPDYASLASVLQEAHNQASAGKGADRHSQGEPFTQQPIMAIGRMCGIGFHAGQIQKKAQEAGRMHERGDHEAAIREFLGVINYAAAAILLVRERSK